MATNWITAAPGVRYRKHPTRKHGARLDRYFTLRFSVDGKQAEEALGWASEGMMGWTFPLASSRQTGSKGPSTNASWRKGKAHGRD